MRLFEFADDDPLRVKLASVAIQLKSKMAETEEPMSVDDFLNLLNDNGVTIDKSDIYDLIKKEPLVNIITAIEGDKVIFKGQGDDEDLEGMNDEQPGENEKILQQMASKQTAKLS